VDNDERQHLRELLRANDSRLRVLELQAAQMGMQTPPHIFTEIESIKAEIIRLQTKLDIFIQTASRTEARQLRAQARAAYIAQEWEKAEELFIQHLLVDPDDADARGRLDAVQRELDLQAFYRAIYELRDQGRWQAVLKAMNSLEEQQPGYPDPENLREWAEYQRDLTYFEGVWVDDEDSTFYARVIDTELWIPYCYMGDTYLTAHLYNCKLVKGNLISRFKWFNSDICGYMLLRAESNDSLVGFW
jgi:hypothetical protein